MIGPFGDASKYISATKFTVDNDELYVDGDSTKVTIVLLDNNGSPLEGLKVTFSVDIGKITDSDITDSTGTAEAMYESGEDAGVGTITAHTGPKDFEITITVKKCEPATIELTAESLILLADGVEYTKITAIPLDEGGNKMKNITIDFNTDLGTLSLNAGSFGSSTELPTNSGDTGEEAIVYLRSNTAGGTANVQASAGTTSSLNIYFYLEVPAFVLLNANPSVIIANGSSISTISATTLDYQGVPMEGVVVSFSSTLGSLSAPVAQTNSDGVATVLLTSVASEGTATVTATAYISNKVDVQFTLDIPYQIDISTSDERVIADGSTKAIITAVPRDDSGNPMSDVIVSFTTDLGTLSAFKDTSDTNGETSVELTSSQDGVATITASVSSVESSTSVIFYEYNPVYIEISAEEASILADGASKVNISAVIKDDSGDEIPGAIVDFSSNYGSLNKTNGVVANQQGIAAVTLTSEGSTWDLPAWIKADVQGVSLSDSVAVTMRGIVMTTYVDSTKFAEGGYYNVYVRTTLIEYTTGAIVNESAVVFNTTIGEMLPQVNNVNDFGEATSILKAQVTGSQQSGLVITTQLPSTNVVSKQTDGMIIPGVEALITTIDDEIMGDGESWALVKATLRETTGKAIENMFINWETTVGTVVGQTLTNSTGQSIDTLRIEHPVSANTNATIRTNFGENIWDSETVTIIPPINDNRLILGFEPDTTGRGIIPCDIDTSIATRDAGITAHFVDENGNGIDGEAITFSVVPNNLAAICETDTSEGNFNGKATVMMAYPPQNIGQIVRVWAEAPDGTRGNIDVVLPKHEEEEEGG